MATPVTLHKLFVGSSDPNNAYAAVKRRWDGNPLIGALKQREADDLLNGDIYSRAMTEQLNRNLLDAIERRRMRKQETETGLFPPPLSNGLGALRR